MPTHVTGQGDIYNGQYRLPDNAPIGWEFNRFVYACYEFQVQKDEKSGHDRLVFQARKGYFEFDLETYKNASEFVAAAIKAGDDIVLQGGMLAEYKTLPHHTTLDIPAVQKDALIVLALSGDQAWQFRRYDAGITTKRDYGLSNGLLRHFDANGARLGAERPGEDGCKFLCFAAKGRADGEVQHFNLHIELLGEGRPLEIMIDPDIPNDGGHLPGY